MNKLNVYFDKLSFFYKTDKNVSSRRKLYNSLWAVLFSLILAGIIFLFAGANPFAIYEKILEGSLKFSYHSFFIYFAIFIISGIAVGIGFKVGLFNIGVSGQMMIGGIITIAYLLKNGATITNIIISLILSVLAGSVLAIIAGLFKAFLNVHEVVSTILINWIIVYLGVWVFKDKFGMQNTLNNGSINLSNVPEFFTTSHFWPVAVAIAITIALVLWVILSRTTLGYKIKMTGMNKNASKYAGVNEKTTIIWTMAFSGALAGLAGWIYFAILNQSYFSGNKTPLTEGFTGIAISLLAHNSPIGSILSGFLFAVIQSGSSYAVTVSNGLSAENLTIISGIILFLSSISVVFLKWNPLSFLRKYLVLINKKEFWSIISIYLNSKKNLWLFFFKEKKITKTKQKAYKAEYKRINKELQNLIDFKYLKSLDADQKIEYYEEAERRKKLLKNELEEKDFYLIKQLATKRKIDIKEGHNRYREKLNLIYEKVFQTNQDFIFVFTQIFKKLFQKNNSKEIN
ncbi:ABC transporter permease [Mycoplasma iguanae]|uniref:ABC transporter permease n=1 Tax=Mycoplasma iguanae TaxID=292461 RepID=A0ABY5R9P4_9MOLU|nr:ABC transporter permease [Mycoplasma iguanae]UVD81710.1 ABC transporter permease [Mycoplasma iguanae]